MYGDLVLIDWYKLIGITKVNAIGKKIKANQKYSWANNWNPWLENWEEKII